MIVVVMGMVIAVMVIVAMAMVMELFLLDHLFQEMLGIAVRALDYLQWVVWLLHSDSPRHLKHYE